VLHELLHTEMPIPMAEMDAELRRQKQWEGELTHTCRNGQKVTVDSRQVLLPDTAATPGGILEINRDITDRKRLENQLFQAQKLESLGRLAGGVAHDFNNILAVVIGYSGIVLEELPQGDPLREQITEIEKAGQRATALTRQLLLFSHRQINSPVNLVLSDAVREMEKMLRRVIREDIQLVLKLDKEATLVHADPGYIEQVLMNLVINARDAMPDGGKLVIETSHTLVTEQYVDSHFDATRGEYALLTVSDTGCGMTPEVKERIFEPFFTTKEQGKGTGLGLATVYGIVKQSGGAIFVYSEIGHGTTFKIFLPAVQGTVEKRVAAPVARELGGSETIMLVEDEDALRKLISDGLRRNGYSVIVNANGREALDVCRDYEGHIDLLLSDVVMPEMSGPELATIFQKLRPEIPVLLMSGYTDRRTNEITAPMIAKPFTLSELMAEIRRMLD
jgi:signal transduction histidine kinase